MAFTKVLPAGISSATNLVIDSINSAGVVTATGIVASTGTFSGNVSIAGTLTYEDVTNIDSVGIITAQSGLNVTGGSVGIGSDNPQNKLDVAGDVKILDNSPRLFFYDANANGASNATGGFEVYDRDGNKNVFCGAFAPNADNLIFGVTGQERARIDSSGRVGIGTDNPISELMVENATQSHITVKTSGSNMAKFGSKGNDVYVGGTAGAANIIFKRNITSIDHPADSGTETFRITSDGALQQTATTGISYFKGSTEYIFGSDTSSPPSGGSEALVQIHQAKTRNTLNINAYQNNAGGPILQFISSRSATVGTLGSVTSSGDALGEFRFAADIGSSTSVYNGAIIRSTATATATSSGVAADLRFFTSPDSTGTGLKERLRITSDGQVNISALDGTFRNPSLTNIQRNGLIIFPSSSNGTNDYSDNHMFSIAQSQGDWLDGVSGNYHSSWGPLWIFHDGAGNYDKRAGIHYDHRSSEQFKFWSSFGDIVFKTDSARSGNDTAETCDTEALRIKYNGKVGIGTDNPFASALTVHGGIKVHGYDYTRAYTGSSHQPAAILDTLDPAQTGEGSGANQGWFSMGWSTTARSGEVMHRNTSDRYYLPGGSTAHGYYIEAGTGEAGGICLDEDSVNVYGSSDSGATFRIIDKDSDIVVAEMQQASWDWEVRGNVNSSSTDLSTISDRRLKIGITTENTVGILSAYSNLQLKSFIRIDSYDFIKNRYEDQEELREVGLIAQEVEEVFPDCVSTKTIFDKRSYSQVEEYLGYELDEIKRVKMGKITFKSIEAIQELIRENNQLKTQLSSLEARIAALEG